MNVDTNRGIKDVRGLEPGCAPGGVIAAQPPPELEHHFGLNWQQEGREHRWYNFGEFGEQAHILSANPYFPLIQGKGIRVLLSKHTG